MVKGKQAGFRKMACEFIAENRAATLATVTPASKPHASIVYCIVHDDLTLFFTTRAEGRKFESLVGNPEVCMIFTGHGSLQQLQLSGRASRVKDDGQVLDLLHELMKLRYEDEKLPRPNVSLVESGTRKEYALFKVTPYEMTYVDFETANIGKYNPDFQKII